MRAPSKLRPWYGPRRPFSYQNEVQPLFDKHCIQCHDFGKEGAKKIVLAGDRNASFNVSYAELWSKGYVGGIGAGPAGHLPPGSWGSKASPLIRLLPGVERWRREDKRALVRVVRAKGGRRESEFVRRFDAHRRLRRAVWKLVQPS